MKFSDKNRALYTFIFAILLWLILPLTTKTTGNTPFIYSGYGYTQIANFNKHPSPPRIRSKIYKQIVWKHERFSLFWLPFWGSKAGQYGLYRTERARRTNRVYFIPLSHKQAQTFADKVNVKLGNSSPVSYWSLYFGWLIILPFGLILYWDSDFFRKLKEWI